MNYGVILPEHWISPDVCVDSTKRELLFANESAALFRAPDRKGEVHYYYTTNGDPVEVGPCPDSDDTFEIWAEDLGVTVTELLELIRDGGRPWAAREPRELEADSQLAIALAEARDQ